MSQSAQTLQNVLGGAKTRGVLGEVVLERLLQDALPRSAYETQYRFDSTGAIVDAIVRSGDRILSVDSKFPLDAYRRLFDAGESARREFSAAVRKHADSIAEKYILPDEHTFDYALMFVPSEGVYYELLMTQDAKYGQIDEYCRAKRVFPVSPNTFYACLSAVAISLQGQKIEENTRHLLAGMSGLKKQFEAFDEVYDRLGTHLRTRAAELRRCRQPPQPRAQFTGTNGARRAPRSVLESPQRHERRVALNVSREIRKRGAPASV